MRINPILQTDMYNYSHFDLIPEEGRRDFQVSHLYNRTKPMILFGLNKIVKKLAKTKITLEDVNEAEKVITAAGLPFPRELWMGVRAVCKGYLPLKIEAVPDGTYVPAGTPFAQISNTVPGYGEIVTHVEAILMKAYFGSGCATRALEISQYLKMMKLPANRVHSFGYRGHKSEEDAQICTEAMLLYMPGSDDSHGLQLAKGSKMGSIPALAHKVVQQWDNENDCYFHAVGWAAHQPNKIIAIVIDTYSAKRFIENTLIPLAVNAKQLGVRIVFRPDSGNVVDQTIAIYTKLLQHGLQTSHNVIIGEGVTFEKIKEWDKHFIQQGIPLEFVFYGIGGGFYSDIDRDYLGFAMKTARAGSKDRMKFSESEIKRSIPGVVKLVNTSDGVTVFADEEIQIEGWGMLETIYMWNPLNAHMDKPIFKNQTWKQIKKITEMQNTEQKAIKLSSSIMKKVETLRAKYK